MGKVVQATPDCIVTIYYRTRRFLLICLIWNAFPTPSNGDPAVGVIQGDVFMSWGINNTDASSSRSVVHPAGPTVIFFPPSNVIGNATPAFRNRVSDIGSVSLGMVSFRLLNLIMADAGRYYYKIYSAIDAGGQFLVIAGNPANVSIMEAADPFENEKYTIQCSAQSTSVPAGMGLTMNYQLMRDNGQIITASDRYSFSSDQSSLIINPLKRQDAGTLVCKAWEHVGAVSQSGPFSLKVFYGPDTGSIHLSPNRTSYELTESSLLSVNCSTDCFPDCQYKWTGPGGSSASSTGLLSIISIGRSQTGQYTCTASNPKIPNKTATVALSVTVFYGPDDRNVSLSPSNTSYQLIEMSPLVVLCVATCVPQCEYRWSGPLVSQSDNMGLLSISQIQRNQNGTFTCTVTNPKISGKSATASFIVIVYYGPGNSVNLGSIPPTIGVDLHQTAPDITCNATCNPPCDYRWYQNGTFYRNGATLSLGIVEKTTRGNYRCEAYNSVLGVNRSSSTSVNITVYYAPEISIKIIPPIAEINSEVHIECLAHGEPPDYKFYNWTHKIGNIELRLVRGFQANQSVSVASFPSITIADMGTYICSVENGIAEPDGGIVQSKEAQIDVVGVPVAFIRDTVFIGEANRSSSIQIPFFSNPMITSLKFFKTWNNALIANDTDTQVYFMEANISTVFYNTNVVLQGMAAVLDFRSLKESDFGQYTLVLYNNKGTATMSVHLQALAPPSPVEQFYFYKFVGQYMEFFFVPGFNGGHQQTFTIQFKPSGSLDESWENTSINGLSEMNERYRLPNGTFLVPVETLQPGRYVFRMFSVNKKNIRIYSQEVSVYIEADPHADLDVRPSIAGIAGGIGGGVVAILITGVVIFLWRRHSHANKATADANSGPACIPTAVDYEALQVKRNEGSLYQELSDIKSCDDTKNSFRRNGSKTTDNQPDYINTKETSCSTQDQDFFMKGENKIYENTSVQK